MNIGDKVKVSQPSLKGENGIIVQLKRQQLAPHMGRCAVKLRDSKIYWFYLFEVKSVK